MLILRDNYYSSPLIMDEDEYLNEVLFSSSVIDEDEYLEKMFASVRAAKKVLPKVADFTELIASKVALHRSDPMRHQKAALIQDLAKSTKLSKKQVGKIFEDIMSKGTKNARAESIDQSIGFANANEKLINSFSPSTVAKTTSAEAGRERVTKSLGTTNKRQAKHNATSVSAAKAPQVSMEGNVNPVIKTSEELRGLTPEDAAVSRDLRNPHFDSSGRITTKHVDNLGNRRKRAAAREMKKIEDAQRYLDGLPTNNANVRQINRQRKQLNKRKNEIRENIRQSDQKLDEYRNAVKENEAVLRERFETNRTNDLQEIEGRAKQIQEQEAARREEERLRRQQNRQRRTGSGSSSGSSSGSVSGGGSGGGSGSALPWLAGIGGIGLVGGGYAAYRHHKNKK